jgi:hypothetical protein
MSGGFTVGAPPVDPGARPAWQAGHEAWSVPVAHWSRVDGHPAKLRLHPGFTPIPHDAPMTRPKGGGAIDVREPPPGWHASVVTDAEGFIVKRTLVPFPAPVSDPVGDPGPRGLRAAKARAGEAAAAAARTKAL